VIIVGNPAAGRRALVGRQLECPKPACTGRLRPWSPARTRTVQRLGGTRLQVRPDRGLCTLCRATQVLLPAVCLPRRAYTVEVAGSVLLDVEHGKPVERAAAAHQVPASTARRWVATVTRAASALTAGAVGVASAFGDPTGCWPPFARPLGRLTGVLCALGGAAAAWTQAATAPAPRAAAGALSGIDYLNLLAGDHRRQVLRGLGVADPDGAFGVSVTGWPLVNAVTGGRLLSTPGG